MTPRWHTHERHLDHVSSQRLCTPSNKTRTRSTHQGVWTTNVSSREQHVHSPPTHRVSRGGGKIVWNKSSFEVTPTTCGHSTKSIQSVKESPRRTASLGLRQPNKPRSMRRMFINILHISRGDGTRPPSIPSVFFPTFLTNPPVR